jgi:hypothetical protein
MKSNDQFFVGKRVKTKNDVKDYPNKAGKVARTANVLGWRTVYVQFDGEKIEHGFAPQELHSA